eukprot:CAMPEP_0173404458 /NCGR_PEP_ID=MMETSP1356-20130122/59412_1 /TAXON_ID=77927 ORGANISM="Hemiselmis virescens, Strain PCC157" /NCGR_SAMPLE_ID=MMETSP1356 /ASSEMBLY_ACC=CAM_ASM_000847 /LENGTH=62 /DNA_ID=CAMNT_0014365141 /DNA_START=290 /DNA_END=478 /DNA_ORIENTATION=-
MTATCHTGNATRPRRYPPPTSLPGSTARTSLGRTLKRPVAPSPQSAAQCQTPGSRKGPRYRV